MQVFYIHPKASGYLINDGTPTNTLYIVDKQAICILYERLGAIIAGGQDDGTLFMPASPNHNISEMITSLEARHIAKEQGYDLPNTTLNSACDRGTIPGATKEHDATKSRWRMPRQEFFVWFEGWKASKDKGFKRGRRPAQS